MSADQLLQFINLQRLPLALGLLIVGVISVRLITGFLDRLGEQLPSRRLAFKKVSAAIRFLVYLGLFIGIASSVLVLTPEALVAIAAGSGLIIGQGVQDLLASLTAGVILLFDQPFQVGDRVSYGSYYGEIKEIGLRSVRLVTLDDNLVTIPNGRFLSEAVASGNAGALDMMVVVDFWIAAAEDFEHAQQLVREAALTSAYVFLDKPVVTLVSDRFMGERFVTRIRLKAYVFDARYEKPFSSDVTRRVKAAFQQAAIRGPDQQYRDFDLNMGREAPRHAR